MNRQHPAEPDAICQAQACMATAAKGGRQVHNWGQAACGTRLTALAAGSSHAHAGGQAAHQTQRGVTMRRKKERVRVVCWKADLHQQVVLRGWDGVSGWSTTTALQCQQWLQLRAAETLLLQVWVSMDPKDQDLCRVCHVPGHALQTAPRGLRSGACRLHVEMARYVTRVIKDSWVQVGSWAVSASLGHTPLPSQSLSKSFSLNCIANDADIHYIPRRMQGLQQAMGEILPAEMHKPAKGDVPAI